MTCLDCSPSKGKLRAFGLRLRQTAQLMVGQPDYDNYLQHRKMTHPDEKAMTREEFFRNRQDSRFGVGNNNGFRCC
jgi:uncharacterized short protein YbdD (DUF466 family)